MAQRGSFFVTSFERLADMAKTSHAVKRLGRERGRPRHPTIDGWVSKDRWKRMQKCNHNWALMSTQLPDQADQPLTADRGIMLPPATKLSLYDILQRSPIRFWSIGPRRDCAGLLRQRHILAGMSLTTTTTTTITVTNNLEHL